MLNETWLQTSMRPDIVRRAARVAIIVGTILALINYGDRMLTLTLDNTAIAKILLTYLVPYGVSTWSAVQVARGNS
ncbi:MAG: nitrate/nitrite transporter NrtS [Pseudomonadales bacterium]